MPQFLDETLDYARQITQAKLLVRMDAGHDDLENLRRCQKHKVDWLIKRNLRKESLEDWLEEAQAHGDCEEPREGKQVWTGTTWKERGGKLYRVVFEVIERTITAEGQRLLVPEIEAATFWTSLKLPAKQVIELYHQHGTSEQFHSEIKSDMDLERLPSGKFATNALVLSLARWPTTSCGCADRPASNRTVSCLRSSGCRSASRSPSSVAKRDPRPDIYGGPLDLPFSSLGPVVLAEQSLAWDLAAALPTVYSSGVPGYLLIGEETMRQFVCGALELQRYSIRRVPDMPP